MDTKTLDENTLKRIKEFFKDVYTEASLNTDAFGDDCAHFQTADIGPVFEQIPPVRFPGKLRRDKSNLTKKEFKAIMTNAVEDPTSQVIGKWYFATSLLDDGNLVFWHFRVVEIEDTKFARLYGVVLEVEGGWESAEPFAVIDKCFFDK